MPGLNLLLLYRSGELAPMPEVARELQHGGAIYGTGLHDVRGELPLEIMALRRPELLAIGSSRAFELRQEYFTRPFACACGALDSIDDAEPLAEALLERHRPKLALLVLDFWWFTTARPQRAKPLQPAQAAEITRAKLLRPLGWLREGTLTPGDYARLLAGSRELQGATPEPKIGVMAIKRGIGIRADGSQLVGVRLGPESRAFYAEARGILADPGPFVLAQGRWRGAEHRYGPDKALVHERLEVLERLIARLRRAGAEVVLLVPPVAPPVAAAMAASGRHGHLAALDARLRALGVEYHGFHDPAPLGGAGLCEFADVHHSGNAMFMRMLRAALRANPRSALAAYADPQALSAAIARDAGSTISDFSPSRRLAPEADYLDAGCRATP